MVTLVTTIKTSMIVMPRRAGLRSPMGRRGSHEPSSAVRSTKSGAPAYPTRRYGRASLSLIAIRLADRPGPGSLSAMSTASSDREAAYACRPRG